MKAKIWVDWVDYNYEDVFAAFDTLEEAAAFVEQDRPNCRAIYRVTLIEEIKHD